MKISIDGIGYADLTPCKESSIDRQSYGLPKDLDMSKILYLQEFRIYPEQRMKGYSKLLLDKIKQYCDDNSLIVCLDAIPLDTTVNSGVLNKMYMNNGFIHVAGAAFNYGYKYD